MSHTTNDPLIFCEGSIDMYHRIAEKLGGEENVLDFMRFYLTPGGTHCTIFLLGLTMAEGMIALMNWVENGIAPDELLLEAYDVQQNPPVPYLQKTQKYYKLSEHPDNVYAEPPYCDRAQQAADRQLKGHPIFGTGK